MKKEFLECGVVINKRGIKGELKLSCLCDSPESIMGIKTVYGKPDGSEEYKVSSVKEYKGFLYLKLKGVDSAEDADMMRGKTLYANRNDIIIDEDKVFIADILGQDVQDFVTGKIYGKLADVYKSAGRDIFVVKDGKNEYLVPSVPEIIIKALPGENILVKAIPGLFGDAEEIRE